MRLRIIMMGFVVVFLSSSAFALIGPPTAGLKKGQWNVGFNYTYLTQDLDDSDVDWEWWADGTLDEVGTTKLKTSDFTYNMYYGKIGYGASDNWEAFVQLGMMDLDEDLDPSSDLSYFEDGKICLSFDTSFVYGFGTKYTFAKQEKMDWGAAFQMNFLDLSWDEESSDGDETWKETVDIEAIEIFLAVGPTIDMDGWKLYGGPFFYYLDGDADSTHRTLDPGSGGIYWSGEASGDVQASSNFGGYIGAGCTVYENYNLAVEFLATTDGWGMGAGIEVPF